MRGSGKRVTIRDVAKLAGCSLGSVSRVVNGHSSVSSETEIRVRRAMDELGYKPNAIARSMRTQTTEAVGFIVNEISNPLFSHIAKAIEDVLAERQQLLVLGNTSNQPAREIELIRSLDGRRVDGLVIAVSNENNPDIVAALKTIRIPVVLLDRDLPLPFDSVLSDHAGGIEKSVRYLHELGHERIGLISGDENTRPGRERLRGFHDGCRTAGIPVDDALVRSGSLSAAFGYEEACDLLRGNQRPTAIIAGGNQILVGVLRAIRLLKLSVPGDISLVGCDETEVAELIEPPITVISRDLEEIGRTAGQLLIRRFEEEGDAAPARRITLPTRLIARGSCSRPRSVTPES